uniref:WW domain-containing protein n=1 Tax=Aureoumbra lagunensis TaxID=44058 RepID=A0A7S3K4K4_9STRA
MNALRSSPLDLKNDPNFVANDLYDLNALAESAGIEPMDLPKDSIRVISDAMRTHPENDYIQETGQALIDKLKAAANAEAPEERMKQKLDDLEGFHEAAADWQMIASSDGNYYYNAATGESTWDQPADHLAFMNELDDLVAIVDDLEDDLSSITPEATKDLVGALGTHARDPGVCGRAAKILNAMGKDPAALDDLADLGSLDMLIPALEHCGSDPDLVNDATELLSNLSKLDKMKAKLSLREYVRVLNQTSLDHMGTSTVVNRCVNILSNLAFNNAEVIGYEYEFNVPYTLKWALQSHLADEETCEACVFAATCLLTDDEPRKKYVCEQLIPEFVECLKLYATQNSFLAKCARCMGSMSIVDECVITMTSAGVVPLIVGGMDVHLDDPKTLKIAVELLSNFGATEDEEHDQLATEALVQGEAIQAIRRVLDEHTNAKQAPLMTSCFDALYNIGNDEDAARVITDEGLCEKTVDCLEQFDFDLHLLRQCVKLISVLTYNDFSVERLTSIHATPALLDALSAHADDEEFVVDNVLALSNLVTVPKVVRIFLEKSYLKDMLELFDVYDNHAEIIKFILITLIRLAADDDLSQKISRDGMPYIMRATANFIEDAEVLSLIFELLGQLAYVKQNLKALVGAGGIRVLLDTLDTFDDSPELIIKTVNTLDNLVSADVEYASVVLERDGEGLLKQCQNKWQNDSGVVRAIDTALLSIRTMIAQKEKQRTNRAALFARLGEDHMDVNKLKTEKLRNRTEDEEPEDDPIKKYRDMLVSGIVLSQWDKGKAINRKLCINADWNALLTRDTQRGSAIQARFPLKSIREIIPGYGTGHQVKSIMSKKAKPTVKEDTCFLLKGLKDDELICFATKSPQDATRIIDALKITLNVFSKWPHRLISG